MRVRLLPKFRPGEASGVARHAEALRKHLADKMEFVDKDADVTIVEAVADSPEVDLYINHGGFLPTEHPLVIQNLVAARRVVSVARWVTEFYKDKYKIEPIVIPNGVDLEEFDQVPEGEFCEKYKIEPGFFLWAKNAIDGARDPTDFIRLARRMPDRQFVMTLFPRLQSPPANVKIVGLLEWEWMKRALKDCGCLVLPSLEVFPIQMLEAWACSKPVLGYAQGGVAEGVNHKKTGYLARLGDFEDLMGGADYIIKHGSKLGKAGRKEVEKKYQWKFIMQRILKICEEAWEEKRKERKVTVTIPCYNLARFVGRAINSVLAQTYQNLELIIVDDGSIDDSPRIAKQVMGNDKRARIIRQENRGLAGALNRGISEGNGEFCLILSADDAIRPTYLEKAIKVLEDDRVGYVYSDMEVLMGPKSRIIRCGPSDLEALKRQNTHAYCYVYRRKFFDRAGGYKDINPSYEDYEFNLNITKLGAKGHHLPEPLFIYQKRGDGREAQSRGMDRFLKAFVHGYHPDLYGNDYLVSVIVPCYNHAQFICEALDSVIAQTYPHWEAIVVDDGSKEPVKATIEPYLKAYPGKVRLVRQENKGLAEARNAGIKEAKGRYIALLDADDKFMPTHLEKSLDQLLKTEAGYTYTDCRIFGKSGDAIITMPEYDFSLLLRQCYHVSSILFPKAIWEEAVQERSFGYDSKMRWGWEDWEWNLWMGKRGHCGVRMGEATYLYRQHEFSMRKSLLESHRHEMRHRIQENHFELFTGGELPMGCCGSRRAPARHSNPGPKTKSNPGNPSDLDYEVTYMGNRTGKLTKVGYSGTVYRFSSLPPYRTQFVSARDIELFRRDAHYEIKERAKPEPKAPPVEVPAPKSPSPEPARELEDDLSIIKSIGAKKAKTLRRLGIKSFDALALANSENLALSTGVSIRTVRNWQTQARKHLSGTD